MAKSTKTNGQGTAAGQEATAAVGFLEAPMDQIFAGKQIRSEIDMEGESFQALKASIAQVGLLEPPLAERCEGGYSLLAGRQRYLACQELGMTTIPIRVLENVGGDAKRISIQLIENLIRKDLNPIDLANACVAYFQALQEGITLEEIIDLLITFERDPERLNDVSAENVSAIADYTGKTPRSIISGLTLLNLPEEIQNGLKTEVVSPSIGYVFAANLDCPHLMEEYQKFIQYPVTVAALKAKFKRYKDAAKARKPGQAAEKKLFPGLSASMTATQAVIAKKLEQDPSAYVKADIEKVLTEIDKFRAFLQEKLLSLPETKPAETAPEQPAPGGNEGGTEEPPPAPTTKKKKIIA